MEFSWGGLWEHEQRIVKLEAMHEKDRKRLLWFTNEKHNQALTSFRTDLKRLEEKVELQIQREVAAHFDVAMQKLKVTNLAEEVEALRRQVTEGEPPQKVEHLDASVRELQDIHQDLKKKVEKASFAETKLTDLEQQVKNLEEIVAKTAQTLNRSESQSKVSKLEKAFEAMKGRQEEFNLQTEVVKEAILHMQQELRKEVVIPEHVLKDLDAKNGSRLETVRTELQHYAEESRPFDEGGCAKSVASSLQESDWAEESTFDQKIEEDCIYLDGVGLLLVMGGCAKSVASSLQESDWAEASTYYFEFQKRHQDLQALECIREEEKGEDQGSADRFEDASSIYSASDCESSHSDSGASSASGASGASCHSYIMR